MRSTWNPFREVEALRQEIDRVFSSHGRGGQSRRCSFLPGLSGRGYPLCNLSENPEAICVEALMPGLDAGSLEVTVKGDALTISGVKPPLEGVRPEQCHRSERAAGRFTRSLKLEAQVDPDQVEARYAEGILRITLPKTEAEKPRQIAVQVA